jgi:hypothetical protein
MRVSPLRLFHRNMPVVLRSSYRHSILPVLGSWAWLVAFPWPLCHTYNHIPVSPRLDRIDSRILCGKDSAWSCGCGDRRFNVAMVQTINESENCSTLWVFAQNSSLLSLLLLSSNQRWSSSFSCSAIYEWWTAAKGRDQQTTELPLHDTGESWQSENGYIFLYTSIMIQYLREHWNRPAAFYKSFLSLHHILYSTLFTWINFCRVLLLREYVVGTNCTTTMYKRYT